LFSQFETMPKIDTKTPCATPIKPPCKVCKRIRLFLMVAVGLMALLWSRPDFALPEGWDYSAMAGDAFLLVFFSIFGYKVYEYWRERRDNPDAGDGLTWMGTSRHPGKRKPKSDQS
jgi:hypothetical protein